MTKFTESDLEKKGFIRQDDGTYRPMKNASLVKRENSVAVVRFQDGQEKTFNTPKVPYNDLLDAKPATEWFIPYQVPSKKNSRQVFVSKNGKIVNIPSKAYVEYVRVTKNYWTIFGKEFKASVQALKLAYPLKIEMTKRSGCKLV